MNPEESQNQEIYLLTKRVIALENKITNNTSNGDARYLDIAQRLAELEQARLVQKALNVKFLKYSETAELTDKDIPLKENLKEGWWDKIFR